MRILDSRRRLKILLGQKVDFVYNVDNTIEKIGKKFNLDAISIGQLDSKMWLITELEKLNFKSLGTILVLCGWYGILPALMFKSNLNMEKIRSIDKDSSCVKIADAINKDNLKGWQFKAIQKDIFDINFSKFSWTTWSNKNKRMSYPIVDIPTTIINTSCEHTTSSWFKNIPPNKLVILQSTNNKNEPDHINCSDNLNDFINTYPLKTTYYCGEKSLDNYDRFMVIGES